MKNLKKSYFILTSVLLVWIAFLFIACTDQEPLYVPGTYTNTAEGYYSTLQVEVIVSSYRIIEINILSHEEPLILAEIVFDQLPDIIIKKNSADVDVISGATYTSKALIEAVKKALEEAYVEDLE